MKTLLIVTTDDYLLYQPVILNLYDYLENDFDITIISFNPEYLGSLKDVKRNIHYIRCNPFKKTMYRIFDLFINALLKRIDKYLFRWRYRTTFIKKYKCTLLIERLQLFSHSNEIVAVDIPALYAVQQVFSKSHFLSLELPVDEPWIRRINLKRVETVITQSRKRFQYLFNNAVIKTFYIQNAPFCRDKNINADVRKELIWAGTIVENFGVLECIRFIEQYKQYNLILKGGGVKKTLNKIKRRFRQLLHDKRLVVDTDYLSKSDFIQYLSKYKIGFCFYDWKLIKTNFNYLTAPSGKLGMYLAAGVPVIGCDIPGFKLINEFEAGILISDYEPATIYKAVCIIENNYSFYQANCYEAFDEICFDKNARSFKDHLLNRSRD